MTALLDDRLLGRALTDTLTEDDLDAIDDDWIGTTGCWYYRLCQAVRSPQVQGRLGAPFTNIPDGELRRRSLDLLAVLPEEIHIAPLRTLAPLMAELLQRHPLNLIALEALAAAHRPGTVVVLDRSNVNPRLTDACRSEGIEVRLVG